MQSYAKIFARAAKRHGEAEVERILSGMVPKTAAELAAIPDDRWLAGMTRRIFEAGFNWKVVDNMWPGFEEVFDGFDVARWALATDDDLDRLAQDRRIVRNPQKIRTVRENAAFLADLTRRHGSAGRFFADWPATDFAGLLDLLKTRGNRLGGSTAQYFLRFSGKDSYILGRDVVAALKLAGVVDKAPSSAKAMRAVQDAFNAWMAESGRPLMQVSRTLALSANA